MLRLGPGERLPAIDADGGRWSCLISSVREGEVLLAVEPAGMVPAQLEDFRSGRGAGTLTIAGGAAEYAAGQDRTPAVHPAASAQALARLGPALPRLTLALALLKGETFDAVLRQATEAGVERIIPFASSRSLGGLASKGRQERFERVVHEALGQSGSPVPTRVEAVVSLEGLPAVLGPGSAGRLALVLHEEPLGRRSLHDYLSASPAEILLCVGPEGGFSAAEIAFLREGAFEPLTLPAAVLRAGTAALYALGAIQTIMSERDTWNLTSG